jgi:Protein of unknown function (DUF2934)
MASAAAAPILIAQEELNVIELTHEKIARRAYEIWESEGKVDGRDQPHWFQAITELTYGTVSEEDDDDEDDEDDAAITGQGSLRSLGRMPLRHVTNRRL